MVDNQAQRLLALFERLEAADRAALIRFAEFLAQQPGLSAAPDAAEAVPVEVPEPAVIARPDREKVVEAIRRLSKTYFMLDKKSMLGATSELVMQHILHGQDAAEVIDQLERIFLESYEHLKQGGA